MPTDFTLPELGENITGGDVVRVLVAPGDTISNEQPVLELETDKATIEVPSTVSGKVTAVNIKQGDRVKVGQVVLTVDTAGASASAEEKAPPKARGQGRRRAGTRGTTGKEGRRAGAGRDRAETQARRSGGDQPRRSKRARAAADAPGRAAAGRARGSRSAVGPASRA